MQDHRPVTLLQPLMNRDPSSAVVVFLCVLVLLVGSVVSRALYERYWVNQELGLFALQAQAEKDFSSGGINAITSLTKYQRALENDIRPQPGIPIHQELMFIHSKKACLYQMMSDGDKYLEERNAIRDLMLHYPNESKGVDATNVDMVVDGMIKATFALLKSEEAKSSLSSPKP